MSGKREADERVKIDAIISTPMSGTSSSNDRVGGGLTRTLATYIDSSISWDDIQWLRRHWKGKIIIKGIQSVEDAKIAVQHGLDGIGLR